MPDTDVIVCPDTGRFPLSEEDRRTTEQAGFRLHEMDGRELQDLRRIGRAAVGCLAWGGWYGEEFFAALPRLRVLARCGAGVDNIDLDSASRHAVRVTYVPGASDDEVGEHAIALMLACFRKLVPSDQAIRRGEWLSSLDLHPIRRLSGSMLGLVGLGRIASAVARKAQGLGMNVIAFDPYVPQATFDALVVRRAETLNSLLSTSDVVSIHMPPLSDQTVVIGADELRAMRPGAILINTSRGRLIDEEALARSLEQGWLGGAGLDVFEIEPLPMRSPLLRCANVVLTPHSAAFSVEALAEIRRRALSDAIAVLQGHEPRDPLTTIQGSGTT
jgi:D-3-phosphoglycerate dehydrogenase